jgi:hypothetical protein
VIVSLLVSKTPRYVFPRLEIYDSFWDVSDLRLGLADFCDLRLLSKTMNRIVTPLLSWTDFVRTTFSKSIVCTGFLATFQENKSPSCYMVKWRPSPLQNFKRPLLPSHIKSLDVRHCCSLPKNVNETAITEILNFNPPPSYMKTLTPSNFPPTLTKLTFSENFRLEVDWRMLPFSLRVLKLPSHYREPIDALKQHGLTITIFIGDNVYD